jgi:hypothetical protein
MARLIGLNQCDIRLRLPRHGDKTDSMDDLPGDMSYAYTG